MTATPCAVCAAKAAAAPFYASRGPDWPVTQVAGRTVHLACADEARRRAADITAGQLLISGGVGRWASNGHVIPAGCAALFAALGLAPDLDLAATGTARDAETAEFLARYRAAQPAEATAAERAGMLAAFGPGELVTDIITGRETQL